MTGQARPAERVGTPSRSVLRTRAALRQGALEVLASQGPDASIDVITARADVAHGTFYEHFETRQDLFADAMAEGLRDFNSWIDDQAGEVIGAAERLALRFRHFGRMPESHPTLAAAFSSAGGVEEGFNASFLAGIDTIVHDGIASGEFGTPRPDAGIAAVTGNAGWLVAVRTAYPQNGTDRVDAVAEFLLTLLGVAPAEAARICRAKGPNLPARRTRKSTSSAARTVPPSAVPATARTQERSRRTRLSIVEATQGLLAERGTDLSIERITERANVSRGSFYRYFDTKAQLFEAASTLGFQEWDDYARPIVGSLASAADQLVMGVRMYGRLPDTHPHVARMFCNLGNFAAGYPHGTDPEYQALHDQAVSAGIFSPDPANARFLTVAGAVEWLIPHRVMNPGIPAAFIDDVLAFLLPGFGLSHEQVAAFLDPDIPDVQMERTA